MIELSFRRQGIATSSASDSGLETPLSDVQDVSEPSEAELRQYEPSFMRKLAKTKTKSAPLNFLYDIMRRDDKSKSSVPERAPKFPDEYVEEFSYENVKHTQIKAAPSLRNFVR